MTPTAGLKRLGFVLLAATAAGLTVLTTAGYLISGDTVRQEAVQGIRAITGFEPILRGPTTVSLFPSGSVSFADMVLGDPKRPALTAERLTARLRFFPLLIGRVEIADVSLERPTIDITVDPNGHSNWSGLIGALAKSEAPGANRPASFSELRIDRGTVVVHDPSRRVAETIENVEFSLAWPSISKSFGATGRFVWHDVPVDAALALSDFPAALAGGRSGLKLRLSGAPMKAAFEGSISVKPTVKIEGTLAADAASLRQALVWAGQKPLPGGGFKRFSIKAQTDITGGTISLTGVNVELDGNAAEGVFTFATDGRQTLQGTLAADTLDLSPYVSTVRLLTADQRAWNDTRIGLDGLSGMDLDLRISAAKVIAGGAQFGHTAIGANLRGGQLVITVGESQAYGGVIQGSLTLANLQGVDVKSQLHFANVDLEPCLTQLFGLRRMEGKGNISLNVEGRGDSVLAVTRTMNGTATLSGKNGALNGFDLEQLLRRLERRPLSGGGEFRNGRTPFETIAVGVNIANGIVTVDDLKIDGTAVRLALAGSASIPERDLDLKGTAALVTAARAGATPFELPFVVQGSWDDPIMLPDAEALIRRSGAAAPLLNAVRGRNAREQVRSVIERLTGSTPEGATPTAEQGPAAAATTGKPE